MDLQTIQKFGVTIPEGKSFFKEGDQATRLFYILQGDVSIFIRADGAQKKVATLHKGDILGEMAIVEDKPRSATAIADTTVKALAITKEQLSTLIKQSPEFGIKMIQKLSAKLRETNDQLTALLSTDRKQLVSKALVEYAIQNGQKSFKGIKVVTEEFLNSATSYLGISRQALRDILKELIKENKIQDALKSTTEIILSEKLIETFRT